MNLFTSRWSPIKSVFSIDPVGILNAWSTNVVPNMARMTVTTRDSKVSRVDDFLTGSSMRFDLLSQLFQYQSRRFLLGSFFIAAPASGYKIVACLGLHGKGFLVLRAGLLHHPVFRRRRSPRLQELLQSGFVIDGEKLSSGCGQILRHNKTGNKI